MAWCHACKTQQYNAETCADCGAPLQPRPPSLGTFFDRKSEEKQKGKANVSVRNGWILLLLFIPGLVLLLRLAISAFFWISGA